MSLPECLLQPGTNEELWKMARRGGCSGRDRRRAAVAGVLGRKYEWFWVHKWTLVHRSLTSQRCFCYVE